MANLNVPLIYTKDTPSEMVDGLHSLITDNALPLTLELVFTADTLTQKKRQRFSEHYGNSILVIDNKQILSLLTESISVSPSWIKHQKRIVSAGRKSELILRACKPNIGDCVLDATAGFGHDGLILASTGADVVMLERNPLMVLLLLHEQKVMAAKKNWQKLMSRLSIHCDDAVIFMQEHLENKFEVIYLDPMFPENSYDNAATGKGAKVAKYMQALHHVASPPDIEEESQLLNLALNCMSNNGRVVVKRPVSAPHLAKHLPDETWQNNVVRFDGYFSG